jgi:hypothetical protein
MVAYNRRRVPLFRSVKRVGILLFFNYFVAQTVLKIPPDAVFLHVFIGKDIVLQAPLDVDNRQVLVLLAFVLSELDFPVGDVFCRRVHGMLRVSVRCIVRGFMTL